MVAPHVGAWIETQIAETESKAVMVAPHVGAWIETGVWHHLDKLRESLPMWERGLKQKAMEVKDVKCKSLPMWERGLKLRKSGTIRQPNKVAPHVGAWIETSAKISTIFEISRSPCGSVD